MGNGLYAILICYDYGFRLDIDQYKFMVSNEETMARAHHLFHFSGAQRQLTQESSALTSSPLYESYDSNGQNRDVNATTHRSSLTADLSAVIQISTDDSALLNHCQVHRDRN
jgi:hypothetical protein